MNTQKTIRTFIAGIFILLFALNSTPRPWLHETLSGHTHHQIIDGKGDHLHTSQSSFQCNWENQLAESPFEAQPALQLSQPVPLFITYAVRLTSALPVSAGDYSSLRGPPSLA